MRRVLYIAVLAATLVPAVTASAAESAGEKRVAQQIGSHLKQSGQLHNYRVGVKYHDGTAYLAGSVADQEQRDIAVRLAQQVEGVSHVVCKLEIENEGKNTAQNAESNDGDGDRQQLSNELDRASYEGAQNDSANVMNAYERPMEPQGYGFQQNQMQRQQMNRSYAPQARRSNMPVPAGRLGGMPMGPNPMMGQMGQGPGQNCQSGVCQAGCNTCNGGGGGMGMGGPGMGMGGMGGEPPAGFVPNGSGRGPSYDNPQMPGYAWPSYASQNNYAAVSYPQQYSPTAWPYIGPFYPYPQVPLAWRKVSLEWDDGWWFLDFSAHNSSH